MAEPTGAELENEREACIAETSEIINKCIPALRGASATAAGAALARLVSLGLAGHAPDVRDEARMLWIDVLDKMTEPTAKSGPWGR